LGVALLVLSLSATPAGAVVARIDNHAYGLTPIRGVNPVRLPAVKRALAASGISATHPLTFDKTSQLVNHGGPVMHSVTTHVVYWDPSGEFTATTKSIVNKFFADVANDSGLASNVFGIAGQYNDGSGHALYSSAVGTEATDNTSYGASGCTIPNEADKSAFYSHCITDAKLQSELSAYIAAHPSLPTGPNQQYFVLLPHNVVTCLPEEEVEVKPGVFVKIHPCSNNFYCAYHSSINGGSSNEIIYSDIPFSLLDSGFVKACQSDENTEVQHPNGDITGGNETTRFADVALKYISHEYIEAATDPLINAWWEDAHGQEIGDKCNFTGSGFEPGEDPNAFLPVLGGSAASGTLFDQAINSDSFYIQSEWDNAAKACTMKPVPISSAGFTRAPTSGLVGAPISFQGAATDIYPGLRFIWKWGDGTESAGASPTHVYAAPRSYEVTMTAKDETTFATTAPVVHTVVVNDQPAAAFTIAPNPATEGVRVAFNGAASIDADGTIVSYTWNFGDGSVGTGATPSHTYVSPGSYAVTLTITDSGGVASAISHGVTILAPAGGSTTVNSTATTALAPTVPILAPVAPSSTFPPGLTAFNQTTGALTLTESVRDPGTFSWLLTFQNGKFGVFAASTTKCKKGLVKLNGKCRPARIVYAKGSKAVAAAGTVTFTIKPTRSALTALKNALKRKKGLPVTVTLTFQSALGGSPVSHTQSLTVKLRKK
jgi:PKD repeat protein